MVARVVFVIDINNIRHPDDKNDLQSIKNGLKESITSLLTEGKIFPSRVEVVTSQDDNFNYTKLIWG